MANCFCHFPDVFFQPVIFMKSALLARKKSIISLKKLISRTFSAKFIDESFYFAVISFKEGFSHKRNLKNLSMHTKELK
jgi:hypothetical protein